MARSTIVDTVTDLVAPILADLALELYDLDFSGGVLRVTIDTPPGQPGGVDLDQIALVTRLLGREMEHDDFMPGRYTLEVTSPGLERTLRTSAHFARETGKTINVRLSEQLEGRRRIQGVLVSSSESSASIRTEEGAVVEVPLALIEKAKTVFVWAAQPKPGSPEAIAAKKAARAEQGADEFEEEHDDNTEVNAS